MGYHVFVSVYISRVITSSCRFTFHGLSRLRVGLHFMGYHVFVLPSFTWDSGNIFPPVPKLVLLINFIRELHRTLQDNFTILKMAESL